MKAQTWAITGEKKFLELMWVDLLSVGYRCNYYGIDKLGDRFTYISINTFNIPDKKEKFNEITTAGCKSDLSRWDRTFSLPEQYNEALGFAKEQLNDKYWVPEYVKCTVKLGYCIVGKIYKTRPRGNSFEWQYEANTISSMETFQRNYNDNWDYTSDKTMQYFEPSTEKEYLGQQVISQLEVGKWYMITSDLFKPYEHISKFAYFTNGRFYYSERVSENRYQSKEDYHCYPDEVRLMGSNVGGNYNNEVRHTEHWFTDDGQLYIDGNLLVYAKETWAEIIPEIKLWDVGTYVVFLMDNIHSNGFMKGDIQQIKNHQEDERISYVSGRTNHFKEIAPNGIANDVHVKWFATKKEAESFAETLKPQFKIGDYVMNSPGTHIGKITKINGNYYSYWGIRNSNLGFIDDKTYCFTPKMRHATPEEIEEFLIKVAKLRGLVTDVRVKRPINYNNQMQGTVGSKYHYDCTNDSIISNSTTIYYRGEWATIIPIESKSVLPKVWFIKLTYANIQRVEKWHRSIDFSTSRCYTINSYYGVHANGTGDAWTDDSLPSGSFIITDEQFDKYVLKTKPAVKLPFGDVIFTIESGGNFATTSYGKIPKKEIADAIYYLENPPTVGGYDLTFFTSKGDQKSMSYMCEKAIGFGCQKGKLSELQVILKAFD